MVYLKFAGVCIGLNFVSTEEPDFFEKPLINKIEKSFGGYFSKPSKIDHTIFFEKKEEYEYLFNLKSKKEYVLVSQSLSPDDSRSFYHISMQQLQIIFRNICQRVVAKEKGVILHSSSAIYNRYGYIFLGNSGAGKSTIVRGLSNKFAPFSDDSSILRKIGNTWYIYQSPILQKNSKIVQTSQGEVIKKVLFLNKSKGVSIVKINDKEEILFRLMKQLYSERESLKKQMSFLMNFVASNDIFYDIRFNLNDFEELESLIRNEKT